MFHGSLVAIVTPMKPDNAIDLDSLTHLVEWHLQNQTDGIVVLGTTGESPTIDHKERQLIIQRVIEEVDDRVPVIVGTGTNSTYTSIGLTQEAMEMGADACLVVVPYYNKPTQEGIYQHFHAIAKSVPVPQILYNVPSRTGVDLLPDTVIRLAKVANIIGLKEATTDAHRVKKILQGTHGNFDVLSGDDNVTLDFMLMGAKGVISVSANVAPHEMHVFCSAMLEGDRSKAESIHQRLMPLHQQLFVEPNPIPVKWALNHMGKISTGIRLPLTPLSAEQQPVVQQALRQAGIV